MKNVFCIGELLIDFIGQPHQGLVKTAQFAKLAGGAPANVAAQVAKLGGEANFIGQIGKDSFGSFLIAELAELGIDLSLTQRFGKTTLAFVALDKFGEREFEFYRGNDGDFSLAKLDLTPIATGDIIHFGSATALLGNQNFISFDPNYRESLVSQADLADYIHDCKTFISYADLVKLSEVEAQLISGEDDLMQAINYLQYLGAATVIVTLGAKGALVANSDGIRTIAGKKITPLDTTGAGDSFVGGLLFKLAQHLEPNWDAFVQFANVVAAHTCTQYGAIKSMPTMRQFLEFVS
jgi:fructokinase